jgi:hypothetical protein
LYVFLNQSGAAHRLILVELAWFHYLPQVWFLYECLFLVEVGARSENHLEKLIFELFPLRGVAEELVYQGDLSLQLRHFLVLELALVAGDVRFGSLVVLR